MDSIKKLLGNTLLKLFAGWMALLVVAWMIALAVQYLLPAASGMARATATAAATEIAPTSFQDWRSTAEAAGMQTRAALIALTTVTPPPTCCPPTLTPMPFATGIFEAHVNPQPFANVWQGIVNGQRVRVYAGGISGSYANTPNLTPGVLKVQVFSPDLSRYESREYQTSEPTGWLQVVAEDNFTLTLTGQNEQSVYFNVLTMQFVAGLTAAGTQPTITPLPPASATPVPPTPYPYPVSRGEASGRGAGLAYGCSSPDASPLLFHIDASPRLGHNGGDIGHHHIRSIPWIF